MSFSGDGEGNHGRVLKRMNLEQRCQPAQRVQATNRRKLPPNDEFRISMECGTWLVKDFWSFVYFLERLCLAVQGTNRPHLRPNRKSRNSSARKSLLLTLGTFPVWIIPLFLSEIAMQQRGHSAYPHSLRRNAIIGYIPRGRQT